MDDPLNETDPSPESPNMMRRLMHGMARLMPSDAESGENARAVAMMRRMLSLKDTFSRETRTRTLAAFTRTSRMACHGRRLLGW